MDTTIVTLPPLNPPAPAAPPPPPSSSTTTQQPDQSQFPAHLKHAHARSSKSAAPAAPAAPTAVKQGKSGKTSVTAAAKQTQSQPTTTTKSTAPAKPTEDASEPEKQDTEQEDPENPTKNSEQTVSDEATTPQTQVKSTATEEESGQPEANAQQHVTTTTTKANTTAQPTALPTVNEATKWNGGSPKQRQQKNPSNNSQDDSTNTTVTAVAANAAVTGATAVATSPIAGGIALDGTAESDGDAMESSSIPAGKGTARQIAANGAQSDDGDDTDNTPANPAAAAAQSAADATVQAAADVKTKVDVKEIAPVAAPLAPVIGGDGTALKPGAGPGSTVSAGAPANAASASGDTTGSANVAKIVTAIGGQLLPGGGTMQIRLDPPELGALQVTVKVQNGIISATFQTSTDEATKALSHTLGQLKQSLEAMGIGVDRLHVQQAPRSENSGAKSDQQSGDGRQDPADQRSSQREEQRREVLKRMWRRVSGGRDPLDLVA
jgi:flagellar hook-length control protein FliK